MIDFSSVAWAGQNLKAFVSVITLTRKGLQLQVFSCLLQDVIWILRR